MPVGKSDDGRGHTAGRARQVVTLLKTAWKRIYREMKLPHQPAKSKAAGDENKDTSRNQPLIGGSTRKQLRQDWLLA